MLYDNALLARAYLHGFQLSGDPALRRTAEETLDWALREMRAPEGGFFSALDADSEGVEGKFYVWTLDELRDALGDDPLTPTPRSRGSARPSQGNFEGANVLESRGPEPPAEQRERIRARLLEVRAQRVRPGLDDKRLASWNALMIARARRGRRGARSARTCSTPPATPRRSCWSAMRDADGRLLRTFNAGQAQLNAYLEDHAFLLEALLTLYEATFEERWFAEARALGDTLLERFADPEHGGFFSTSSDHEQLVARRKDLEDAPIPSGGSSAALGLLRLAALTGEASLRGGRARPPAAPARARRRGTRPRSATCCRRSTSTSRRRARSRWRATDRVAALARRRARAAAPARRARRRRRRRTERPSRCSRAAGRSTAAPPPTCASASPASAR